MRKLFKYTKMLALLAAMMPLINQLIESVEVDGLSGKEKKDLVINSLKNIWVGVVERQFPAISMFPVEDFLDWVGNLIDLTVNIKNSIGIFQKSVPASN